MLNVKKEKNVQELQCDILLEAINRYLRWRNNKSTPDGRNYKLGLFTKLRHTTSFGETRAKKLRDFLSSPAVFNPIKVLQEHLKVKSTINNHSLDTYLLENILNNKEFFLITETIKLETKSSRAELREKVIAQTNTPAEYSYHIARHYEEHKKDIQKAYNYYVFAAQQGCKASLSKLSSLASQGNSEAQYLLGVDYYHYKGQYNEAIHWSMLAAEKNHARAIAYLQHTEFKAEHYLMIASQYEEGKEVKENIASALFFYEKASTLPGGSAAGFFLGQFYQIDHAGFPKNRGLAFQFYLRAARLKNYDALEALERLGEEVNAENQLALSELYSIVFKDREKAAYWHERAREVIKHPSVGI